MEASVVDITRVQEVLKDKNISSQQALALLFIATGNSADEAADEMCISPKTIDRHISMSKPKLGYSKATEISGYIICTALGLDYEQVVEYLRDQARKAIEQRRMILR
ncbi:LuxR C-terminal-related transcriptional regulator [Dysgonomonas massiliensis]|uniref:LuxR C-terminal-related transcriptional regulator n=1 Tax=Dysgonomonas massiliensis TaxID=2040292 RepID=UPI000C77D7FC|nr:helix-turn-helix domain-containing protein [Dysgonomonas massiliensis]